MPTIFSARGLAEIALQNIGSFPVTEDAVDPKELSRAVQRLELIMNDTLGQNSVTSTWKTLEIPLQANVNRYRIAAFTDDDGVDFVFDTFLQDIQSGVSTTRNLMESITEREWNRLDKSIVGDPQRTFVDRTNDPYLNVNPMPGSDYVAGTRAIRLQIQSFATRITSQGTGGVNINFRPTWYLFLTNKLSYELGKGAIRRLPEAELDRYQKDYMISEMNLISGDGAQITGLDSCTQPWGQ